MPGMDYLSIKNKHIQWIINNIVEMPDTLDRLRYEMMPNELKTITLKTFVIYCSYTKTNFLTKKYEVKEQ